MSWVVEHLQRDGTVVARMRLTGDQLRIGRALDNDLVLDDPHCAAHHAVLRIDADGQAQLHDLDTVNGIRVGTRRGKSSRHAVYPLQDGDTRIQLGNSYIRVRHAGWALAPERPLSQRLMWPYALLALLLVLGYAGWDLWLRDVREGSLPYLYTLSMLTAGLAVWSAVYALLGRLLGGPDRFFTHVLIACTAYLGATLLHNTLQLLAFSAYWLWPLRIASYATVVVLALTVRAHLRVADPRHWDVTRWGVALAALMAIAVPLGQTWITSKRLTHIQVMALTEHPALRLAPPASIANFMDGVAKLQGRADTQRVIGLEKEVDEGEEE